MTCLEDFVGEYVTVELSGNKSINGYLIDNGLDILAINYENEVYYIPLRHVQNLAFGSPKEGGGAAPSDGDHPFRVEQETISFRKVLQQAKGHFVEIHIAGNIPIHGYLTSIMNDYFVFHSPVYKTIFVTLSHLKWLLPYPEDVTPYALSPEAIPHRTVPRSLPRTFKDQCQRLSGQLVVFDMGQHANKIGQLKSVDVQTNMVEIIEANGVKHLLNLEHLKAAYLP